MTVPSVVLALLLARSSSAFFTPTEPSPGDSYNSGENCTIAWIPDTDGVWTNVTINLMSGSNTDMTLVSNVASFLDGTDPALTPFSWLCPDVSPNSAIYFYQFTNNDDITESKWTTRFTIASPNGESSPPEYSLQPTGDYIPWGVGHLSTADDADDDYDGGSDVTSDSPDTFTGDSSICKREPRDHYRFDTSEDAYDHDHGEDDDHYSDSDPEVLRDEPDDEEDQEANETTGHSGSSTRMAEDKAANVPTSSQVSYQSYETVTSESPSASSTLITAYDASLTPAQTPSTIAQPLETTSAGSSPVTSSTKGPNPTVEKVAQSGTSTIASVASTPTPGLPPKKKSHSSSSAVPMSVASAAPGTQCQCPPASTNNRMMSNGVRSDKNPSSLILFLSSVTVVSLALL